MGPEAMRALVEHVGAQWPEQLSGQQDTSLVIAAIQCGHCEPCALEQLLPASQSTSWLLYSILSQRIL